MGICECCGNEYEKTFEIIMNGKAYSFDSFECAIHILAPRCAGCDMKIIGHGVELDGTTYCCSHCSQKGQLSETSKMPKGHSRISQ